MYSAGIREKLPLETVGFRIFPAIVEQRNMLADMGFNRWLGRVLLSSREYCHLDQGGCPWKG